MKKCVFILAICAIPTVSSAQTRYLLSADLVETYNSDVFASEAATEGWDLITEVRPRAFVSIAHQLGMLTFEYSFRFQMYGRTIDPYTGRNLVGYGNNLRAAYTRRFNARWDLELINEVGQGTENMSVMPHMSSMGVVPGFIVTGYSHFYEHLLARLSYRLSRRWTLIPFVGFDLYLPYGGTDEELFMVPASQTGGSTGLTANYDMRRTVLYGSASTTYMLNNREVYPRPMAQILASLSVGARHEFNDFWIGSAGVGTDIRYMEFHPQESMTALGNTTTVPTGQASITYRYGPEFSGTLSYSHRYSVFLAMQDSSVYETDIISLDLYYVWRPWVFEAMGLLQLLREDSPGMTEEEKVLTKVGRVGAMATRSLFPGVSLDVQYQFEGIADRSSYAMIMENYLAPPDYGRHLVSIGLTVAWPPTEQVRQSNEEQVERTARERSERNASFR